MIRYLSLEEVLELHRLALQQSGGLDGVRDLGGLDSAVAQPQMSFGGQELYPSLAEKAVALGFSLVRNHPFLDGNKRVGHAAMETFLVLNGWELAAEVDEQEQVILQLAAGNLKREDLTAWVQSHLHRRPAEPGAEKGAARMNVLEFTLLIGLGSLLAGLIGALTGLGGGVVIVPLLVLGFGVDMRYAIGASLVSVIATSSGAAAAYVKEGYTNIRIGMFLEVATTFGAVAGAFLAAHVTGSAIAVVFGVVLLGSAFLSARPRSDVNLSAGPDPLATRLRLGGTFPTPAGLQRYEVRHVPLGFGIMFVAGLLSGLLGIGSGALKVLAMDQAMGIPFKVSTTTSNFMIGVTAAASAGIYLSRGYIDPGLSMPVMLGVLLGSLVGARLLPGAKPRVLRIVFAVVIVVLGIEMIYNGLTGKM